VPKAIGQFHIKGLLAAGGMGTVYRAAQEHPRRTMAVKVMKHGIASRSAMRRFEYEFQTLPPLRQRVDAKSHRTYAGASVSPVHCRKVA
jgi:serine/threonine protein kinase